MVLFLISLNAGYYAVLRYRLDHSGLPLGPAAVVLASSWTLALAVFPLVILLSRTAGSHRAAGAGCCSAIRWRSPAWS